MCVNIFLGFGDPEMDEVEIIKGIKEGGKGPGLRLAAVATFVPVFIGELRQGGPARFFQYMAPVSLHKSAHLVQQSLFQMKERKKV